MAVSIIFKPIFYEVGKAATETVKRDVPEYVDNMIRTGQITDRQTRNIISLIRTLPQVQALGLNPEEMGHLARFVAIRIRTSPSIPMLLGSKS